METLAEEASPQQIAVAARELNCRSVAYTYNDPVIFMEYAIDVAQACHDLGILSVAVTAGYICGEPRETFFQHMDATNVDLKAFTERFYYQLTGAHLQPVLDTLRYIKQETSTWLEITVLLIPDENDSDRELHALSQWVYDNLGAKVPIHFTAFHPDWKMMHKSATALETLLRARNIAMNTGLHYVYVGSVYVGNVHDKNASSTYCSQCHQRLIGRDWYVLTDWHLTHNGDCAFCGAHCEGIFDVKPGNWGSKLAYSNYTLCALV